MATDDNHNSEQNNTGLTDGDPQVQPAEDLGGNVNKPVPETGDPPANPPAAPAPQEATQEGEVAVANPTATVMVMEEGADRPQHV